MHCTEHEHRPATGVCRSCQAEFCGDCLVFSFGDLRPPYCIDCALVASGVRTAPATTTPPSPLA